MRRMFIALAAGLIATTVLPLSPSAAPETGGVAAVDPVSAVPSSWTLGGVVLLARHGLRAPQSPIPCRGADDINCMNSQSQRPWPSFGVAAGNLLPHGYEAARVLGAYFRTRYAAAGLLPEQACPEGGNAALLYADDERTAMTAGGLADGMLPGCAVEIEVDENAYEPQDESCVADPKTTRDAAAAFVGGSWSALAKGDLKGPIAAMDAVVGRYSKAFCAELGLPGDCSLADARATRTNPGPIQLASTPSELFLMEYGGDFAKPDVAWGKLERATGRSLPDALEFVNRTHALYFAATNMPKQIASPAGSKSLNSVVTALEELASEHDEPDTNFFVYVSHDNYLLNIAGMLGLAWQLDGYAPLQVPPGGAIAFELWRTAGGRPMVRIVYFAQTAQQLRALSVLDEHHPPATEVLEVAGCDGPHGACPWSRFLAIARGAIEPQCTE
jgi:4-phytase/acid phosphatase